MSKKVKKRVRPMPKLGWKDQLLYWVIMVLTIGGSVGSMGFPAYYRSKIAAEDPDVIAYAMGKGALHCFWLAFWLFGCFILVVTMLYQRRIPVFGRRDINYGPPVYPNIYPVLMKNKPKYWKSPSAMARKRKWTVVVSCVALLTLVFSIAIYPRSLYGRYMLYRDGSVTVYDPYDRWSGHYAISDIGSVCLTTNSRGGGRSSSGKWYARMTIDFADGEGCSFSIRDFGDDWTTAIQMARSLKDGYGLLVRIEGTKNLWKVVYDGDMSSDEADMLYELYEVG